MHHSNIRHKRKLRQFFIYDLPRADTVSVFEMSYDASFVWTADYLFNFLANMRFVPFDFLLLSSNTSREAHDLRAWVASNLSGKESGTTGLSMFLFIIFHDDFSADHTSHAQWKLFPSIFCVYIEALISKKNSCINKEIKWIIETKGDSKTWLREQFLFIFFINIYFS